MSSTNNRIIVLDDHYFRGAGIVSLMNSWGFESELCRASFPDEVTDLQPIKVNGAAACLLVVGGVSILTDEVADLVTHYLKVLGEHPLVIVSDGVDSDEIRTAIDSGVRGILPTHMTSNVAMAAIRFILAGGHYFPHSVSKVERAPSWVPRRLDPVLPESVALSTELPRAAEVQEAPLEGASVKLSKRQVEVLRYLERGLSNKAIGQELELCEATVKIHVRQLMRKLGVGNRTQVALLATSLRGTDRSQWVRQA